ncbi:MAG: hypothetical protein ACYCVM_06200 [Acidiferrobacter sp.]
MQQVIDLLEVGGAAFELVFDHAPTPGIRAGVPHSPGDPLELGKLIDSLVQG